MIERLSLKKFGRFVNTDFSFAPSVIFHGPNESGKTTIFDALFTSLCRVPRRNPYQAAIYLRYGDAMEAGIAPAMLEESFEVSAFEDLHAIRSGDVTLTFGDDAAWASAVKNALFSGGIDPLAVADELALMASEKTTVKHNKEISQLRALREKTVAERERLESERLRHAEQTRAGEELTQKLEQSEAGIAACDNAIAALTRVLEEEERIAQRRMLEDTFSLMEKEAGLREALTHMTGDLSKTLAEIGEKESVITRVTGERDRLKAEVAALESDRRERESERKDLENRQAAGSPLARKADILIGKIDAFLGDAHRRLKVATVWNTPLALVSGLVALAGVIAGILVHPACFAALLALAGVWMARKTTTVEDLDAVTRISTGVRDEFRNAGGHELSASGLQGMADELRGVVIANNRLEEGLSRVTQGTAKIRERIDAADRNLRDAEERLREQESRRALVLQSAGVSGKDEIIARVAGQKNKTEQCEGLAADIRKRMIAAGFKERDEFRSDVRRKLEDADRDGVPREGRVPAEVQKTRNQLAAEQERKRSLERALGNVKEQRGIAVGLTRSLGGVLEELLSKNGELARIDRAIAELELNKCGAALAEGIFRAMATDSGAMLTVLAAEMQSVFGGLVGAHPTVAVQTFNSEAMQATDAGGVLRGISHLSKGTRDTLTFAARLTLALKSTPGEDHRLLVLDEPFTSLDPARIANALAMVRRIQDDHDWQVVLFTKDPVLADDAVAILKDPVRHDLA
jgi:DNA repair exonuclease SbcCD ATPase subunit